MSDPGSELDWCGGTVPVSRRFDDRYFCIGNGLAETRHVFLAGNGLPDRFRPGFHIAELGFGTGLNMLAALILWRQAGIAGVLRYTSFEAFPLPAPDIFRALQAFPEAAAVAGPFLAQWGAGQRQIRCEGLEAEIVEGDARTTLLRWQGQADAWFLDGFSPAKNPELWSEPLLAQVVAHTIAGGSFATYTAAGQVRRALATAGFTVERVAGFGLKRHMTKGLKP